jgi:hypothetical protein
MQRLTLFLGSMIGSTLAAVFVVAALVSGVTGLWALIGSAVAGYASGWPAAWVVAKRMR